MCLVALAARCAVQIDCIFVVMRCPKAHGHSVRCELLAIVVPALINNAGLPIVSPALLINAGPDNGCTEQRIEMNPSFQLVRRRNPT
jgi:hypothetical protein